MREIDSALLDRLWALGRPALNRKASDRPWVTVAYAQTLDGRIATRTGDSQWISGPEALVFSHCLRASHDAILVGIGTVLADNPRLTTRHVPGPSPRRVVVDSRLRLPDDAALLADDGAAPIIVAAESADAGRIVALRARGARVLVTPPDPEGRVDLRDALRQLRRDGIGSVLVEGGAGMITAALRERLADRLAVCVAMKLIGSGIEAVGELDIRRLADAMALAEPTMLPLAGDLLVVGDLR